MNKLLVAKTNPKLLTNGADMFHHVPDNKYFTIEEIRRRVETVTPLLMDIKDYRPPDHWGINE
jgi:hypothetical protein